MKNIEDINRANVQKIASKKKMPEFFPGDTIRVGVRKIEILILHLLLGKFHLGKESKEHLHYTAQLLDL